MNKKYNKEKFKRAMNRVVLAFEILVGIGIVVNIICKILIHAINLFK